jgi:hypothetical protein
MTKGIIAPAKVVCCALQDAASVVGLLLTTEVVVARVLKKPSAAPASAGRDRLLIRSAICCETRSLRMTKARAQVQAFCFRSKTTHGLHDRAGFGTSPA